MIRDKDRRAAYEERAERLYPDNEITFGAGAVQEAYVDGALYGDMTTPAVIRTREELEALDYDTVLEDRTKQPYLAGEARGAIDAGESEGDWLPAVVITTGERVRYARKSLVEEA